MASFLHNYNYSHHSTALFQCTVNGVNYDKLLHGAGAKVKTLEIFFFGCPKIVGLHHFPNLCILRIVNQKISSMKGIECCGSLEELWISEAEIEVSIHVRRVCDCYDTHACTCIRIIRKS